MQGIGTRWSMIRMWNRMIDRISQEEEIGVGRSHGSIPHFHSMWRQMLGLASLEFWRNVSLATTSFTRYVTRTQSSWAIEPWRTWRVSSQFTTKRFWENTMKNSTLPQQLPHTATARQGSGRSVPCLGNVASQMWCTEPNSPPHHPHQVNRTTATTGSSKHTQDALSISKKDLQDIRDQLG